MGDILDRLGLRRNGVITQAAPFEDRDGALYVTLWAQIGLTPQVLAVLRVAATKPQTRSQLQQAAKLKDREHFRKSYLEPLVAAGLLEMTIPDGPQSSRQRYRTTAAGAQLLQRGVGDNR